MRTAAKTCAEKLSGMARTLNENTCNTGNQMGTNDSQEWTEHQWGEVKENRASITESRRGRIDKERRVSDKMRKRSKVKSKKR